MLGVPEAALKLIVISTLDAGAERPDVSMLLRMFSTLVAESEVQESQVERKQPLAGVAVHESKKLAGKSIKLLHWNQVWLKLVTLAILSSGKLVRLEQALHA